MKERKFLLEDAQHATKAALEEGIVPGGGVALLALRQGRRCARTSKATKPWARRSSRNVLDQPMRAIADNAGQDGAVVVNTRAASPSKNDGYDADKDEYCDLLEAGIVDPGQGRPHRLAECRQRGHLAVDHFLPDHRHSQGKGRSARRHGGGMGGGMGGMGGMGGGMGGMGGMGDF